MKIILTEGEKELAKAIIESYQKNEEVLKDIKESLETLKKKYDEIKIALKATEENEATLVAMLSKKHGCEVTSGDIVSALREQI